LYQTLKTVLLAVLPKKALLRLENTARPALYWLAYRGDAHECLVCTRPLKAFVALPNGETLCPACGSLPRNRRLWQLLNSPEIGLKNKRILDFSPSRCLYYTMKKQANMDYTSTDFADEFIADKRYDITNIPEKDNSFDLVCCYHVLEHIPDDAAAMRELYRITAANGCVLIQTPFKTGDIYENPAITTPADRLLHFGQDDHVRIYSVIGLQQRLEAVGFQIRVKTFAADVRLGLREGEVVLVATKI
jgi:SAM-dependent methyltransferase